ncbi:carbon storage regulator [Anaerotignum faecicola]|nr:carbon storage regulator [Anaerotignum faecicola]
MLVLQRREGESIRIGDDIELTVTEINPGVVKIAIKAPKEISILRTELIIAADMNKESILKSGDIQMIKNIAKKDANGR